MVGGKAFRLAQLRKYGLTVPPGLVLTTKFFEAQITATKLTPLWAGSPDIAVTAEALTWLADALKLKPLVKELAAALETQLRLKFHSDINSFAVRSSVIDEDQRDHSFAGMHLTELGVPRSALGIAISRCWASALSGPAVKYRQVHGLSIQGIRVALLIQPMLSPQCAGVAFTMNPLTGARDEMIVEATWGLGNALVSGKAQPHFYKIAIQPPVYPIIEYHPGNASPPANGSVTGTDKPLSAEQITALAHQLEQIEALMGDPQDIEWAYDDNIFSILQSRPVTTAHQAEPTQNMEWSRNGYPHSLPELPSPLFGAFLESAQPQLIRLFKELGITIEQIYPYEKLILGRPYLNLTLLKLMMTQLGITSGSFLNFLGDAKTSTTPTVFTIDWNTAWLVRPIYRTILKQVRLAAEGVSRLQHILNQDMATFHPPTPDASSDQLLAQLRQQIQLYGRLRTNQLKLMIGQVMLTGLGSKFLAPATPTPIFEMTLLAAAEANLKQDKLHQHLLSISKSIASQASPNESAPSPLFGQTTIPKNASTELRESFDKLLNQFGWRADFDADPAQPRYGEAPNLLWERIGHYANDETLSTYHHASPSKGLNSVPFWRKGLVKPITKRLCALLEKQDALQESLAHFMTAVRAWHQMLGQTWVNNGWLENSEDIFWLTIEEIERTLRIKADMAVTLTSIIGARKAMYEVYAQTSVPFFVKDTEIASIQFGGSVAGSSSSTSDVIVGLPVSPGQARGTVVVVRQPTDVQEMTGDVILVMPSTDPAWLALLSSAAGLIVETGGLLSHGSVIAREYGLPAVANIPQATQRFQTGDKVLVDGSTGVIQLLESPLSSPTTS
ncbi:MAG: hypothetical protein KDJ52_04175 [Anaerolineae bacterium]|nr:hypothetical protein [Anaerolineae bacterium]